MFVNTLALRARLGQASAFDDLLAQVRRTALEAFEHQDLPFEKLVEDLHPRRDLSRHPVFQVLLAFQNVKPGHLGFPGVTLEALEIESGTTKFDLTFNLSEGEEGIAGYLEYATALFDPSTVERLVGHLRNLLAGIAAAPETPWAELPLLGEEERAPAPRLERGGSCGGGRHDTFRPLRRPSGADAGRPCPRGRRRAADLRRAAAPVRAAGPAAAGPGGGAERWAPPSFLPATRG